MAWTAPRTWTAGEFPTAAMFNANLRDNLKSIGDSTAYTPTIGGAASPTLRCRYSLADKWLHVKFAITLTGTPTASFLSISLPSGMTLAATSPAESVGVATLRDNSAALRRLGQVVIASSTTVTIVYEQTNVLTSVTTAAPWTWAIDDSLAGSFTVEIA